MFSRGYVHHGVKQQHESVNDVVFWCNHPAKGECLHGGLENMQCDDLLAGWQDKEQDREITRVAITFISCRESRQYILTIKTTGCLTFH